MEPGTHKASAAVARDLVAVSLPKFCGYFLRLGATGFGGPIALAGYMQRDLVERRRWVTREDYLEGLALAQLAPGLLAAQLAIYLGYLRAGILGASLVGLAFIGPSFLMVLAIASANVRYGGLSWMQPAFYGIGAGVVAIIARSAWKLARMVLHKDRLLWSIFLVLAVSTGITGREVIWLFLLGGVVAYIAKAAPRLRRPHAGIYVPLFAVGLAAHGKVLELLLFFIKAGAFVFGSGLAIVPFLYGGVVQQHHWLTDRQFLDAVAVAMITPGPGGDHFRFHRVFSCRPVGCNGRCGWCVRAGLSRCSIYQPFLRTDRKKSTSEGSTRRRDRCSDWRYCRRGVRPWSPCCP
jgi:chromate transporter